MTTCVRDRVRDVIVALKKKKAEQLRGASIGLDEAVVIAHSIRCHPCLKQLGLGFRVYGFRLGLRIWGLVFSVFRI